MKLDRRQFSKLGVAAITAPRYRDASDAHRRENADFIDGRIGASTSRELGEGKTFPGPCMPFGMVQLGPDTVTGGDNAPG